MASDGKKKHQQLRPHAHFAVGSDIEVTSDEEGFRGIWFPATILSLPSRTRKNQYLVEYKGLLSSEEGSDLLTEYAHRSCLRPALTTEEGDESSFELNDVVEAFHLDGWWIGVVIAVLEDRKYRVFFNNPPDEVEFGRSSLRLHKDWVDGKWIRPKKKEKELSHANYLAQINGKCVHPLQVAQISNAEEDLDPNLNINGIISSPPGNSGDMIELRSDQGEQVVPSERENVDYRSIPSQIEGLEDQLPENLEAHAPDNMEDNASNGNSSSSCRKMAAEGKNSMNKKASSKRRRVKKAGRTPNPEIGTPRKSTAEIGKATLEKENATDDIVNDGILALAKESEHEEEDFNDERSSPNIKGGSPHGSLTTQDKSNVDDNKVTGGNETLRKSRRQRKSVYESCILALKPGRKKRRLIIEPLSSSQESEASPNCIAVPEANPKCIPEPEPDSKGGAGDINDDDRPLSILLADSRSPPIVVESTQKVPEEIVATKTLPFKKISPIWKVVEEMEVFQQIPQNPHFKPLYNAKEDCKEGLAIGYMVTFSNLVQKISKLGFGDPKSLIDDSLETLPELERHGFEVEPIRSRLNELNSIKTRHECSRHEFKRIKGQIVERQRENANADEDIKEIDKMIAELMERRERAVRDIEKKEGELEELESRMESVKGGFEAGQEEFERIVKKPW